MARMMFSLVISFTFLIFAFQTSASNIRRFAAASKSLHLRRRAFNFNPHDGEQSLLFQDESSTESAARVRFIPKYPTLVLDDILDHVKDVTCTTSKMMIHFHNDEAMNLAAKSWDTDSNFVLFSTHPTCATSGEHEAYMVRYISSDVTSHTIILEATKQTLKQATHRITIDIGRDLLGDISPKIVRRNVQSTTTVLPSTTIYNFQTASLSPTVSFQFEAPTATPSSSNTTKDISFSLIEATVLPPNPAIIELFPGAGPLQFVGLGCQNCSMVGSVFLEAAGFNVNSNELDQVIDFFDDGFFEFATHNVAAHMEFEIALLQGFKASIFTANLTKIPLTPIEIPNVITLGPVLELTIPIGVTLNQALNFTTGFDLAIPDNSKIIMNISEITGSSQTGFDKTSFNALPFNATSNNFSFNLTAALKPKLTISAGVGNTNLGLGVSGGVGAFLEFPRLIAQIDTMENVNSACNGPAAEYTTNRAFHVTPSATFDIGLHWELGFRLATIEQGRGGEQILASQTFGLPAQCLIYDEKIETPTSTNPSGTAEATAASTSGAGTKKSAGSRRMDRISNCAIILFLTGFIFITL